MARTSISDEQIVSAALAVIVARGYSAATTREIAAAAGINEVTLFRRFGSKERLLRAVVESEAQAFGAAGISYSGDLAGDLLRVVQFYEHLMQTRGRVILTLIAEVPRQPELAAVVQTPLRIFAEIGGLVARYQAAGALAPEPPAQALAALLGPLLLGGMLGVMQPGLASPPFDAQAHVARYLAGRALAGGGALDGLVG